MLRYGSVQMPDGILFVETFFSGVSEDIHVRARVCMGRAAFCSKSSLNKET